MYCSGLALSFGLGGYLPDASALWIIALPFCGALTGDIILTRIMRRTGRTSILAFLLSSLAALGAIIVLITGIISIVNDSNTGASPLSTGSFC